MSDWKGERSFITTDLDDNAHVLKPTVLKHNAASQITIFHFSPFMYPINTLNKAALSGFVITHSFLGLFLFFKSYLSLRPDLDESINITELGYNVWRKTRGWLTGAVVLGSV